MTIRPPLLALMFAGVFVAATASAHDVPILEVRPHTPAGPYPVTAWKADWPGCEFEDGVSEKRVTIVEDAGQRWWRILYPRGSHGSDLGGAGWRLPFGRHEGAELRYVVMFEEGFDFNRGGKLPGLCGGPKTITGGDAVNGLEGFSARVMWRKDGRGQGYIYHMHQPDKYGDEFDFPEDFRFVPGQAAELRIAVTMNHPGKRDGTLRIFAGPPGAEARLMVERTDMEWRRADTYGVDSLLFNTFHGGSGPDWAPSHDCHARFTDFRVFSR